MRWFRRDIWKPGITIAGMLLLLVLIVWVPVSAADAQETASELVMPVTVTVQATPTVDATGTALSKEQQTQQVKQLQLQNDRSIAAWFWNSSTTLGTIVAALLAVAGVLVTVVANFRQWWGNLKTAQDKERQDRKDAQDKELKDRLDARAKQAEERFQKVVEGLGSDTEQARVGAAIMLHTFLQPGYEQFHRQTFELAVANLRLVQPISLQPSSSSVGPLLLATLVDRPHPFPPQGGTSPSSLNQALAAVFKDSFRLARNELREKQEPPFRSEMLDARGVRLYGGYFYHADLEQAWLPQAILMRAFLYEANLSGAQLGSALLINADLRGANLQKADLSGAYLMYTKLEVAQDPNGDNRHITDLTEADFRKAILVGADLTGADLYRADLRGADLCIRLLVPDNQSGKFYFIEPDFDKQKLRVTAGQSHLIKPISMSLVCPSKTILGHCKRATSNVLLALHAKFFQRFV